MKMVLTANLARFETLAERGMVGTEEAREAVLGLGSAIMVTGSHEVTTRPTADSEEGRRPGLPRPELDLSERPYLTNRMKVDWDAWSLPKILAALEAATENKVAFLLGPALDPADAAQFVLSLRLPEPVKVVTAMQAVADYFSEQGLCFAITEYGVLLEYRDAVEAKPVPTIPSGIPYRPDRR